MKRTLVALAVLLVLSSSAALAHHGWGSYDAAKKFVIAAPVENVSLAKSPRPSHAET